MHEFHDSTSILTFPLQGRSCFGADEPFGLILSLIKQPPVLAAWSQVAQQGRFMLLDSRFFSKAGRYSCQ